MSEYFHYINHTKEQRFCIGDLGGAIGFNAIGHNLGARGFCLLLTESNDKAKKYENTLLGYWVGDLVQCIGDHGNLQEKYLDYQEIAGDVIVLLLDIDGSNSIVEISKNNEDFFLRLCHIAIAKNNKSLINALDKGYERKWRKRYSEISSDKKYVKIYNPVLEPNT